MTPVSQPPNAEEVVTLAEQVARQAEWASVAKFHSEREHRYAQAILATLRSHSTLTASNAALQREKAAAMGLVEGHALTVMKLERERDAAQAEIAAMKEQDSTMVPMEALTAAQARIAEMEARCDTYFRAMESKQAKIDALMLEFCPGEMSAEQRAEWARNQTSAPPSPPGERL